MNKNLVILLIVLAECLFHGCAARMNSRVGGQCAVEDRCRRYAREGYRVLPGMPGLHEQVEKLISWEQDSSCILIPVTAKGESYNTAKMQAENQAKIELTGRLESRVATLAKVDTRVTDEGKRGGEVDNRTSVESKIVASSSLKNLVYVMELFRVLKSGETEIILVVGYKQ